MSTHTHTTVPLSSETMATVDKIIGLDLEKKLTGLDGHYGDVNRVTVLMEELSTQANRFEVVAIMAGPVYVDLMIDAVLTKRQNTRYRVLAFFEGSLSSAYDLVPADIEPA